jgi:hypothetical protein
MRTKLSHLRPSTLELLKSAPGRRGNPSQGLTRFVALRGQTFFTSGTGRLPWEGP